MVRRSEGLVVVVLCPHFERPVEAVQNVVAGRLVDCHEKESCVTVASDDRGVVARSYPRGCPVFRARA
ncbi:MAG: hypothetical protein EXR73_08335 [Myxococcales bacterium]|nr:hypothetical protein [Myxococcales bacterium]